MIKLVTCLTLVFPQTSISFTSYRTLLAPNTIASPTHGLKSLPGPYDTLTSGLASITRLPRGKNVRPDALPSPTRLIKFYNLENDPQCRLVRECITELNLIIDEVVTPTDDNDVVVPRLILEGVNGQQETLTSADDIISRLENIFTLRAAPDLSSNSEPPSSSSYQPPSWTSTIATLLRYPRAQRASFHPGALPSNPTLSTPLILYDYENNQFSRVVREVLTELRLPYTLRTAGIGSSRREELSDRRQDGGTGCPYLVDPNTGTEMAESRDIVAYLYDTYASWTPPSEILGVLSAVISPVTKPLFRVVAMWQAGGDDNFDRQAAKDRVREEVMAAPVVVYTYDLSPFCGECKVLLDRLGVSYEEISLGSEWIPGLIRRPETRAILGEMYGMTSLPHVFVGGESVGGLYDGNPGLVPLLERGGWDDLLERAEKMMGVETGV